MLAVGMERGKTGVHMFKLPMPEIKQPDEVLVRVQEVVGSKVKSLAISDPVTMTVPRG